MFISLCDATKPAATCKWKCRNRSGCGSRPTGRASDLLTRDALHRHTRLPGHMDQACFANAAEPRMTRRRRGGWSSRPRFAPAFFRSDVPSLIPPHCHAQPNGFHPPPPPPPSACRFARYGYALAISSLSRVATVPPISGRLRSSSQASICPDLLSPPPIPKRSTSSPMPGRSGPPPPPFLPPPPDPDLEPPPLPFLPFLFFLFLPKSGLRSLGRGLLGMMGFPFHTKRTPSRVFSYLVSKKGSLVQRRVGASEDTCGSADGHKRATHGERACCTPHT